MSDTPDPATSEKAASLNLDHDEARAVHRIVRAIHDGECPKCRSLHLATEMWTERIVFDGKQQLVSGWQCPQCGFFVTEAEGIDSTAAQGFSEDLAVFRRWRTLRVVQAAPAREDWRVAKPLELSPIATSPPADTPTAEGTGMSLDKLDATCPIGWYWCDLYVPAGRTPLAHELNQIRRWDGKELRHGGFVSSMSNFMNFRPAVPASSLAEVKGQLVAMREERDSAQRIQHATAIDVLNISVKLTAAQSRIRELEAMQNQQQPEPRCGFCGTKLTLVRPGSHQCDNPECESNQ